MRIAYQGVQGAYSEAAALRLKPSADLLPCPAFEDVFDAVDTQKATHGIVPIENTIGGTIHQNYDLLLEHELTIVAEVKLAGRPSFDRQSRHHVGPGAAGLLTPPRAETV